MLVGRVVIKGKHVYFEVGLDSEGGAEVYSPFPVILLFDDHVLVGECWSVDSGKLQGTYTDPVMVIGGLLHGLEQILYAEHDEWGCSHPRETARDKGFDVSDDSPFYCALLAMQSYVFFEGLGDLVMVHYYNGLLEGTDCPAYKGRYKGSIEVPLVEFGEDMLKVVGEYLEKYYKRVEEVRGEAYGYDGIDGCNLLIKQYLEDLEDWRVLKGKFGSETHRSQSS